MSNVVRPPVWMNDPVDSGGGPPHDGGMESRVAKLEAIIPTLATKADVAELRTDIERGQKENRTWMLATVIALFLGVLAVGNFIANGLRSGHGAPAAQPAPIIIQIPAQPTPPEPTKTP